MSIKHSRYLIPNSKNKQPTMMEVIRDDRWNHFYNSDKDIKMADTRWRLEKRYNAIKVEKERRAIKIISYQDVPKTQPEAKPSLKKCNAITMTGKPCPFRATSACGKFCKKHILV